MTVYKYFLKLAYENKGLILIYSFIYFAMTILIGRGLKAGSDDYVDYGLNVAYMNYSDSELANTFISSLSDKNFLEEVEYSEDDIKEKIYLYAHDAVVVIPEDFEERVSNGDTVVEVYRDERNSKTIYLDNFINKFFVFVNAMKSSGGYDGEKLSNVFKTEAEVHLVGDRNELEKSANNFFDSFFRIMGYAIMGMFIATFGKIVLEFNYEPLHQRAMVSSKSNLKFNWELFFGEVSLAALVLVAYVLGLYLYKGEFFKMVPMDVYIVNLFAFSVSILGMSFLINSLAKNLFAINALSNLISLGLSFISGIFVPQYLLGEGTLKIAKFFPSYYYVNVIENGTSIGDVKWDIAIQLLFGAVYFIIGVYVFRARRNERA